MKIFQLFFTSFSFFCCVHSVQSQNTWTDHVIGFSSDTYHSDIASGYDGSILVAGIYGEDAYFQGGHAYIQKYDSAHQLIWTCNLDSLELLWNYQSFTSLQLLPMENGTVVVGIQRFECNTQHMRNF